jgi:hypothetical protein
MVAEWFKGTRMRVGARNRQGADHIMGNHCWGMVIR